MNQEEQGPVWNEHTILSQSMNGVPSDLFRKTKKKEVVQDPELAKALQLRAGEGSIQGLIDCLTELQSKEPAFAYAAAVDTVRAFETLIKRHSNISDEAMQIVGGAFTCAIFNAGTNQSGSLIECNPDELIVDLSDS